MTTATQNLQSSVWDGSLPIEIRLTPSECRVYDQADPYFVQHPRLSYLPFLLPRLHAFFIPSLINPDVIPYDGWFSFEEVPLKWQYPLGLLYDLFSGASPSQASGMDIHDRSPSDDWPEQSLVRPDADGKVLHDAFINGVKEADFLRNGTAKGIMSLSKDDSTKLWNAVQEHDFDAFNPISKRLLYAQGAPLRHIPLKIYLPSSPTAAEPTSGHLRVVQSLVTPSLSNSREQQTLGTALHALLPTLFPSRRTPILAKPVLHGAVVPMGASVEELMRIAAYLDGWIHLGVVMIG
ncbi:MAG: autophagy protein 5 [Alectoria sarmentosa]|nr:MAG: autophagy protein 5 [Alectoria sarmentosa]